MKTTLVIMAAGIGSRFGGGIKQLEPVGPGGEIIMDYSIHDALEAGFEKVVFIIRKDLEKDFKEVIGNRIERIAEVAYAYQELADLPEGFTLPEGRTKPWGTGQAVLSIKGLVDGPFAVINSDDYYGKECFKNMHRYMTEEMDTERKIYDICMSGFILANTLSENGTVTRGVCQENPDGTLKEVAETYQIRMTPEGLAGADESGARIALDASQPVSMNMWGLPVSFLDELERGFPEFLASVPDGDIKKEYLLPRIIDKLIKSGQATVKILNTPDKWFGVTYKEDKEQVVNAIRGLIEAGVYKEKLFS
ncbi:MAG: nucleotidyltransferase [Lachnospiraceae bacterium]|jgi:dTDP-glucose pyrophosphorylase|nr:nucleotidyltransferase [Lachnospiraceae bacterium]